MDQTIQHLRHLPTPVSAGLASRLEELSHSLSPATALAVAEELANLSAGEEANANYPAARILTAQEIRIKERALGEDHPALAADLIHEALLDFRSGDAAAALDPARRGENLAREATRLRLRALPTDSALAAARIRPTAVGLLVTLAVENPGLGWNSDAWNAVILARGLVLDELAGRHRDILWSRDSTLAALDDSLAVERSRLAALVLDPHPRATADAREEAHASRAHCELLETSLAERSAFARAAIERSRVEYQDVVRALPAGRVLVGYVRYDRILRVPQGDGGDQRHAVALDTLASYAAFVAESGDREPRVVDLGRADSLDSLVQAWRPLAGPVDTAGTDAARETASKLAGEALRAACWDRIAAALPDSGRVELVADGVLQLVPFGGLPSARGGFEMEGPRLVERMSCERDLAEPAGPRGAPVGLAAFGGADYDVTPGDSDLTRSAVAAMTPPVYRGRAPTCREFRDIVVPSLPASALEVEDLARIWRSGAAIADSMTIVYEGASATEEAFKRTAPHARVLHLATHGYFLASACGDSARAAPGAQAEAADAGDDNPLVRCGLLLAGANRRAMRSTSGDDGVLTAEEIATLDLGATDLAVLSACNSGLGDVHPLEGLFGLQRAFEVAGARQLVLTLWPIDDAESREWAHRFYDGYCTRHVDAAEAARAACLAILAARRARHESTLPWTWAAFVALGAPDPAGPTR